MPGGWLSDLFTGVSLGGEITFDVAATGPEELRASGKMLGLEIRVFILFHHNSLGGLPDMTVGEEGRSIDNRTLMCAIVT